LLAVFFRDESGGPVATILQGLAGGTLLHVVMLEILASQRASGVAGLRGVFAVMAGFCGMLALQEAGEYRFTKTSPRRTNIF